MPTLHDLFSAVTLPEPCDGAEVLLPLLKCDEGVWVASAEHYVQPIVTPLASAGKPCGGKDVEVK